MTKTTKEAQINVITRDGEEENHRVLDKLDKLIATFHLPKTFVLFALRETIDSPFSRSVNKMKIVGFIPVRGGSKSIPMKNIKNLLGRPLLFWMLDELLEVTDDVYVYTDSEQIREKVTSAYTEVTSVHLMDRPTDTATDTASSESALLDFCRKVECDIVVFGQATSPLVEAKFINRGIEMTSQGYDSIASVVRQRRFVWGIDMGGNGVAKNYDPLNRPRRQDFDGYLVENGAFYISRRIDILNTNCRISGKIGLVEMPEETYFEIDEPSDWCIAEELLRLRLRKNKTWSKIKTLVLDIDGVFTDAGMYYNDSGEAMKKFNTKDGMALQIARENGIEIAIITGEKHNINTRRMEKLKVNQLFQGVTDKYHVLKKIARNKETSLCNIAYVGDDINDVTCLLGAGLSFAPADSEEKAKANADIVLNRRGGYGAVREAVEKIIKYNNRNRED